MPTQLITESENGHELSLQVHDTFQLQLPESRMGGYRWQLLQTGEPVLKSAEINTKAAGSLPGQSNIRTWQFTVEQPGSVQIHLQHRRPWERDKPAREFVLNRQSRRLSRNAVNQQLWPRQS